MKKILSVAMIIALVTVSTMAKDANGYTRAAVEITNYGTLSFKVGGEDQDDQNSSTDAFVVDRKVDLVVAHEDSGYVIVNPNNKNKFLTFTVRNDGNDVQDYHLSYVKDGNNPWETNKDNQDMDNVRIFVDKVADGSPYNVNDDTETYIDQLDPDANRTVFIVVDVNGSVQTTEVANYTLLAATRDANDSNQEGGPLTKQNDDADDPATVQNVFADAKGNGLDADVKNGEHSDWDGFKVEAALISFEKWSIVIKDPVNGTGAGRKRIPGALIRYCFDINNSGDKNATNVSWTDDLNETATKHDALDYNDSVAWLQNQDTCACATHNDGTTGSIDANGVVTLTVEDENDSDNSTIETNKQACGWIEATIR